MKRIISNVMLVAAAAMAFFACQKPEVIVPEFEEVNGLTFSSEKPSFDDETKTEWTDETIKWSKGDKIRIAYTCGNVWQNAEGTATDSEEEGSKTAKFYPSTELAEASDVAQFEVPGKFVGNTEGEYVFFGVYPSSVVGSSDMKNAPSFNVILPSVQTPLADSFDSESDVMVARSASYVGMPDEAISLRWERRVAHAQITLKDVKNITDDEQVYSVKITAQDNANMVGMQKYNMATGGFVLHEDNDDANVLEINGANLSVENGNIVFWASFLPCIWESFTIEVNTDKATYTREVESCSLEFKQNARNTLAINMNRDDVVVEAQVAEVTATLTFDSTSKRTEYSTSKQVWVESGITLTNNKASSTNNVADYAKPARFYANSSIVLEAPGNITSIIFDCNEPSHATALKNSIGSTATASSDKVTVSLASAVEVFTISKLTAQVRMDAVTVTYQTAGGSSENPDTTPELNVTETALQIEYVEASAHVSVSTKNLYDIEANAFADADCTTDCEWLAAEWTPEGISYTVTKNTSNELRKGYIQITGLDLENNEYSEVITVSQATSFIAEVTIKEFLAKEVHPYMWYQLTGKMSNIVEGNAFGNFDITDDTGSTVYVYGLTATKRPSNDQSFNSLGLRNGDELTLIGTRAVYNSKAQVGGPAYYVEHVEAPYIEVSPLTIKVSAEETEATFTVDSNVDWNVMSEDVNDWDIADNGTVTVYFSENVTSEEVNYEVTVTSEVKDVVVTINQGKRGATAKYYVKVTTAPADWSGTYLITANASSANVSGLVTLSSMNAYNSNSYGKYVKITEAESGMVLSEESVDAYQVVIAKTSNGYSIKFGEYYLGKNSKSNDLKAYKTFTTKECEWTFNGLKIVSFNKNAYNLQWNNNNGQERFACYKGTQKDVVLYKLQD